MIPHLVAGGAAVGAWWSQAVPTALLWAIGVAAGWRRSVPLLVLAVVLVVAWRGDLAQRGLQVPDSGPFDAWVTLVDDPRPSGPIRVVATVRHDGRRLTASAHGSVAGRLDDALAGERVRLVGTIRPLLPGDSWARWRHIVGRVTVERIDGHTPGAPVARVANALRRALTRGAEALGRNDRAVFLGMVIGDDRDQQPVVADDFRAAGLGHLLVVSGQNVAFVLAVAAPIVGRSRPGVRVVVLLSVLAGFALLTRFEPSVLRAVAMAGIGLGGAALGRPADGRRGLSWAVVGLLAVDPFLLRQVAFQLSVAATAGIVWLSAPLAQRIPGPTVVATPVATTIAAQLGVAPVLLVTFGPLPLASLPANIAAGPMSGAVMIWGCTAGLAAGMVGGPVATALHVPTRVMLWWIGGVASTAAAGPAAVLGGEAVVALGVAAVLVLRPRRTGRRIGALIAAVTFAVAVARAPSPPVGRAVIAPGITLWSGGGATALILDDPPRPQRLLEALRRAGANRVSLIVALDGDRADADAVLALRARYGPVAVAVPPGHRVPGGRTVQVGQLIRVGDLELVVTDLRTRLVVRVIRGPPDRVAAMAAEARATVVELGETAFDITTRALVMGILNRTPDSFYDGGEYWSFDDFLTKAERLVEEGADFLDVGGSKAGPGPEVTVQEEMDRVVPAIAALRARFDLPISVDTFRASVLEESLKAGACVGNDISGFADPRFVEVAAAHGASVVATHVRIGPRIPDPEPIYDDVRRDVTEFLRVRAEQALAAGIPRPRVMVDAGLDLGKTPTMSAELLRHSDDLVALGFPVFLSASNKGFLGELTGTDVDDRREATFGAHALGIALGCRILRAHDVKGNRRLADTMSAVLAHRRS